ncbi:MAG: YbaK/EbsC family protein [Synergistaceae bacterium]|jgi:prolyl-tRNA editing enzyme YbaK/EbsC (Cys-tRNA(Pro) deacylase)|nr:YbaK/EbsC family protein [Synergistaceae bacterium]
MTRENDSVQKVREFLSSSRCDSNIVHTEETIFTVEDASRAVGAPPEHILKSLLFVGDDGEWALALMSGSNKVHDKKLKRALGSACKIHMASAEAIKTFSGFEPGGVPPVGYDKQPKTVLDEDLFKYGTVWSAAGTDHDFFPISPDELLRITAGITSNIKK